MTFGSRSLDSRRATRFAIQFSERGPTRDSASSGDLECLLVQTGQANRLGLHLCGLNSQKRWSRSREKAVKCLGDKRYRLRRLLRLVENARGNIIIVVVVVEYPLSLALSRSQSTFSPPASFRGFPDCDS